MKDKIEDLISVYFRNVFGFGFKNFQSNESDLNLIRS